MKPRLTVVVPLYNKAHTIRRSLASIANQTFSDFEILIVDDGSTDGGAAIAAAFDDPRTRVIRQANRGPGAARNAGVREASGGLVAFLDADDEWLPAFLARCVALLDERAEVGAIVCGYLQGPQRVSTQAYWRRRGIVRGLVRIVPSTPALEAVTLLAYMNPWATVARRSALERYGGFYEAGCRYGEDNYLWLKFLLNESIWLESEPLVHWHDESSDLSRNLRGPRPVEPFFLAPDALYATCPPASHQLLHDILAIRAGKTAAMLSFWGRWRDGRRLVDRFSTARDLRYRWVQIGRASSTPAGSLAGSLVRTLLAAAPLVKAIGSASFGRP